MSTLSPVVEETPYFEAEEIQTKIYRVTNESLDSTRRMKALCADSEDVGSKTLAELHDQDRKLDSIDEGMRDIHEELVTADKTLHGMSGWGLRFPWSKRTPESSVFEKNDNETKKGGGGSRRELSNVSVSTSGGEFISKYTNSAQEEEMESNLAEVSSMLGNMRNMALDLGTEINNSISKIERINTMAEENSARIAKTNKQTNKLLR